MDHRAQKRLSEGDESGFMSVTEFAARLNVSTKTIVRAILSGKLNAINIGSKNKKLYRIPNSEIHRIALFDLQQLVDKMVEEKISHKESQ